MKSGIKLRDRSRDCGMCKDVFKDVNFISIFLEQSPKLDPQTTSGKRKTRHLMLRIFCQPFYDGWVDAFLESSGINKHRAHASMEAPL